MATMTNAFNQAYRTTCIPKDNRLDTFIPNEYIGREIEVVIFPVFKQPEYNAETLAAMQEVRDIRAGKIKTKSYATVEEMNAALDAEED
ncbi:MAG: hypothetical protein LBU89_06325 [Fibromonadaceae bacterium]|nr:hypothetical protein [Fibromonadaceae bacterium]